MRLTMKPGVDLACTGTLPQALDSSKIASATAASVCSPETTSTSFISGTGLKKCMPTRRCGACSPRAMAVTLIDEVLVASTACGPSRPSRSRNSARLASRFSTMASTAKAAPRACSSAASGRRRARAACAWPAAIRPLASRPSRVLPICSQAVAAAPSRMSNSHTGWPAWAATCAMPAPMMPAPTTRTGAPCRGGWREVVIGESTVRVAWRGRRRSRRGPRRCRARG